MARWLVLSSIPRPTDGPLMESGAEGLASKVFFSYFLSG